MSAGFNLAPDLEYCGKDPSESESTSHSRNSTNYLQGNTITTESGRSPTSVEMLQVPFCSAPVMTDHSAGDQNLTEPTTPSASGTREPCDKQTGCLL